MDLFCKTCNTKFESNYSLQRHVASSKLHRKRLAQREYEKAAIDEDEESCVNFFSGSSDDQFQLPLDSVNSYQMDVSWYTIFADF